MIDKSYITCHGTGTCVGGQKSDIPHLKFPFLVWGGNHPRYGSKAFTEDGAASVEDIALAACETPDYVVLASRFGTTPEHVRQAVDYAVATRFLRQ
jgi:hypothetical protein